MSVSIKYWALKVQIVGWAGYDPQPGAVTCTFGDRFGRIWSVEAKFYNVSDKELDHNSNYPLPGHLQCDRITRSGDVDGRCVAEICFQAPVWSSGTETQIDTVQIFEDQLVECEMMMPNDIVQHLIVVTGRIREDDI